MSEIVDDLKISNLEVVSNLGVRLSGDAAEIKTTQADATLSVTSDGNLTLTSTTGRIDLNSDDVLVGNATGAIGFYGKIPVSRPTEPNPHLVAITNAGSTNAVFRDTTFTGDIGTSDYTIGDIVRALKNLGLLT